MSSFNSTHLKTLLATSYAPQGAVGRIPLAWAEQIEAEIIPQLATIKLSRSDLHHFCQDRNNSIESCFISVMAWGGMRVVHGRRVWGKRKEWIPTLRRLRSENPSRKDAFDQLKELRNDKKLPGMRAPYFTKLIFFLRPNKDGYIMDRWTARSINLLCDQKIVKMNSAGYVADENDGDTYESFCSFVDALAAIYVQKRLSSQEFPQGFRGDHAEELIFAKPRSKWREYLDKN